MKRVLVLASILLTTAAANAQIKKGQFLAGGNVSFEHSKEGDVKTNTFIVNPNVGYFVIDKLAAGAEVNYTYDKATWETPLGKAEDKTTAIVFAPFVRYYVLPAAQKVNVFAHGSYGFGSTKSNDSDSRSVSQYRLAAGPAFFLSPSVALEASVYYKSTKVEHALNRENAFGLQVGFQIHLGK